MHFGRPNGNVKMPTIIIKNLTNIRQVVVISRDRKEPSYPFVYQTGDHYINITFLDYYSSEISGGRNVQGLQKLIYLSGTDPFCSSGLEAAAPKILIRASAYSASLCSSVFFCVCADAAAVLLVITKSIA